MDTIGKLYKNFLDRNAAYEKQHGDCAKEKQHSKGKQTARERIELLFDTGTFDEIDAFTRTAPAESNFGKVVTAYGDGVIIGHKNKIGN
jgi:acetyl-CoA carboxylase carboxyltransferase component